VGVVWHAPTAPNGKTCCHEALRHTAMRLRP
jgi:hypothetical protein